MALLIPTITLTSGITVTNGIAIISELNVSNNVSTSERLDVINAPLDGEAINDNYQIVESTNGGKAASYMVSLFMNKQAFEDGKPPVEQLKDGRQTKVFSVNLLEPVYKDLTARKSAYAHLSTQPGFEDATEVESIEV
tara:strand:- start:1004 stop:1417 length:414 start_codon:yes stop_codon:yes gene_type:complete